MRRSLLALALFLLAARCQAGLYMGCTSCMPAAYPVMHPAATVYSGPALTASYAPAMSYQASYAPAYSAPLYAAPLYAAPIYAPAPVPAVQPIHLTLAAPVAPVAPLRAAAAPDAGAGFDAALARIQKQMDALAGIVEKHAATLLDHEKRIQAAEKLSRSLPKASE